LAREIRGVVAAPIAGEVRGLRIRAERTRAHDLVGLDPGSDDRVRRFAGLDPVDDRGQCIEVVNSDTAAANETLLAP
jgi:hypothetical protein